MLKGCFYNHRKTPIFSSLDPARRAGDNQIEFHPLEEKPKHTARTMVLIVVCEPRKSQGDSGSARPVGPAGVLHSRPQRSSQKRKTGKEVSGERSPEVKPTMGDNWGCPRSLKGPIGVSSHDHCRDRCRLGLKGDKKRKPVPDSRDTGLRDWGLRGSGDPAE